MKISLTGKYKSLHTFESDELSNFCIITGRNGSGKTQLIEAINAQVNPSGQPNHLRPSYQVPVNPRRGRMQFEGLHVKNVAVVNNQTWQAKTSHLVNQFINLDKTVKPFLETLINNGLQYT